MCSPPSLQRPKRSCSVRLPPKSEKVQPTCLPAEAREDVLLEPPCRGPGGCPPRAFRRSQGEVQRVPPCRGPGGSAPCASRQSQGKMQRMSPSRGPGRAAHSPCHSRGSLRTFYEKGFFNSNDPCSHELHSLQKSLAYTGTGQPAYLPDCLPACRAVRRAW